MRRNIQQCGYFFCASSQKANDSHNGDDVRRMLDDYDDSGVWSWGGKAKEKYFASSLNIITTTTTVLQEA